VLITFMIMRDLLQNQWWVLVFSAEIGSPFEEYIMVPLLFQILTVAEDRRTWCL
jgi:hypothetical protein